MRGCHRFGAALSTSASKAHDATTQSPTTGVETPNSDSVNDPINDPVNASLLAELSFFLSSWL